MNRICAGALAIGLAAMPMAAPVQARELKFSSDTFQVIGSMKDERPVQVVPRNKKMASLFRKRRGGYSSTERTDRRARMPLQIETVPFPRGMAPGSILVRTSERRLYFVLPGGEAMAYPIGVGREGFQWSGSNRISRKAVWPDWRPPQVMINREAAKGKIIPAFMEGGPDNPLGARALYLGSTQFRIHGTTQPWSIGQAVSSGCIRMMNEHVIDLYDRVRIGAHVVVE